MLKGSPYPLSSAESGPGVSYMAARRGALSSLFGKRTKKYRRYIWGLIRFMIQRPYPICVCGEFVCLACLVAERTGCVWCRRRSTRSDFLCSFAQPSRNRKTGGRSSVHVMGCSDRRISGRSRGGGGLLRTDFGDSMQKCSTAGLAL